MSVDYLLDTSIVSLLAPGRRDLPIGLADKLRITADRLFVPTIALTEIRSGICKLRRIGAAERASRIEDWLTSLRRGFADRVVPFGVEEADAAGIIADAAFASGRHPGFADVAIAGTAKARGLAILTENLRHFLPLGVPAYDLAGMP